MPGLASYAVAARALLRASADVPRLMGLRRFAGDPDIAYVPEAQLVELERGFTAQTAMEPTAGLGHLTPLQQHIMFATNNDHGYEALATVVRERAATLELTSGDIEAFAQREAEDKLAYFARARDHFKAVALERARAEKAAAKH